MNIAAAPNSFEYPTLKRLLQEDPIFACLSKMDVTMLLKDVRRHAFSQGEAIFSEGMVADHFFLIVAGEIEVFRATPGGDEKLFGYYRHGQLVELYSMFMKMPVFSLNGRGTQDGIAYSFERNALSGIAQKNPGLTRALLQHMSQKAHAYMNQVDFFTGSNAEQRLAAFLLYLSDLQDGTRLKLPCHQKQIGSRLGIRGETVSRTLGRFKINGFVEQKGSQLQILNRPALEQLLGVEYRNMEMWT
ncbi:Crp/Fnr family transcriptional regulator [Marinobacter sp. SS13-12]|uniref:Crp/Fnr family transcriptional regulator n=1 Tax=Marinobacter sp. SS13-12 TaxID=3050451 RepID=UPI0025575347|nr:Crp/Fnr family transcriptional regulator [Marinobacter sp. SS13-12]MDK8463311.1 Crp/Fnr family transcriptional regulator [Marinobacter sp. SS13-12]